MTNNDRHLLRLIYIDLLFTITITHSQLKHFYKRRRFNSKPIKFLISQSYYGIHNNYYSQPINCFNQPITLEHFFRDNHIRTCIIGL